MKWIYFITILLQSEFVCDFLSLICLENAVVLHLTPVNKAVFVACKCLFLTLSLSAAQFLLNSDF